MADDEDQRPPLLPLSRDDVLRRVRPGDIVHLAIASNAYVQLALNWALHVKKMLAVQAKQHSNIPFTG
eukprot:2780431-Pleurochrysis_carterae.AAC.5